MNKAESIVLNLLGKGRENARSITYISMVTGYDIRTVNHIISNIIKKYGVPIVSTRQGERTGVYIPTNERELNIGLQHYERQALDMLKRTTKVRHNFESYYSNEESMH